MSLAGDILEQIRVQDTGRARRDRTERGGMTW